MPSRSRFRLILSLLLVPQTNAGLCAQREPTLERGSRIEIVSEKLSDGIGVGWLVSLTADTLTYVNTTAVIAVALEDIGQLRVNVGRDKAAMNAATLFGAILGAGLAPLVSPMSSACRLGLRGGDECSEEVPTEVVGALVGAGVFRLLTRLELNERWVNVRLDRLSYSARSQSRP